MTTDSDVMMPPHYDVMHVPMHDDSSVGYLIHTIAPGNNTQTGLNHKQVLTFKYTGDSKCIRLHPHLCGFRVRAAFRTKSDANTNESDANITLSPGWFWHLFDTYKLKVANNNDVENLSYPGIYADTMNKFRGSEFKNNYGELCGYIPDEGNGAADDNPGLTCVITKTSLTAITGAADNTGAGTHLYPVAMSTANWRDYNNGFVRRMARYNYTVDDGAVRYVEEFFPLSQISGFFGTDTSLMNTTFEVQLTRKARGDYKNSVFGSGTTVLDFGNVENATDTGLLSVTLELLEQIPNLKLEAELAATFERTDRTPKPIAFLSGIVLQHHIGIQELYTISETSFHVPRYVLLIFKGASHDGATADNNLAYQDGQCSKNFSLNSHANIEYVQVTINGQEFPNLKQDARFLENCFSAFYQQYIFTCSSLGQDPSLTMNDFRDLYFIAAFDCSDQRKKESSKTTNLQVKIKRRAVPAANTDRKNPRFLDCYMIVLEDKFLQIDAKKGICTAYSTVV